MSLRSYLVSTAVIAVALAAPVAAHGETLNGALAKAYDGSKLVRFVESYEAPTMPLERCAETDGMDLFVFASPNGAQARLVAALDNLGKGASGAAVQNLNLLCGLDETAGLKL